MMKHMRGFALEHRGFTLLEMVIALGVAGMMMAGVWQAAGVADRTVQSNYLATHALSVAISAQNYLTANRTTVLTLVPALDDIARIKVMTSDATGATPSLQAAGNLPADFINSNSYSQTYLFYVQRQDAGTLGVADANDRLIGFVLTSGGQAIDDSIALSALSKLGAAGGFMFSADNPAAPAAATTVRGVAGGWGLDLSTGNWPTAVGALATQGHLFINTALLPAGGDAGTGGAGSIDELTDGKTNYSSLYNVALGEGSANSSTGFFNTVVGAGSMSVSTSGFGNSAYGAGVMVSNLGGSNNSVFGQSSFYSAQSANYTTSMGYQSMLSSPGPQTGSANTGIGSLTLYSVTSGGYNMAIGYASMSAITTGSYNTAVGHLSMGNNGWTSTSNYNTAAGSYSFYSPAGNYNTSVGSNTTKTTSSAHTACENVAVGHNVLSVATTACNNTAIGTMASMNISTGNSNVAIGANALLRNTTGNENIAIGYSANDGAYWGTPTTGSYNTIVGSYAGAACRSESSLLIVGYRAGGSYVCSDEITAVGTRALYQFSSGIANTYSTAIGKNAFASGGIENTGVGAYVASSTATTAGNYNVAFGAEALYSANAATYNVALGYAALRTNGNPAASGTSNIAAGASALYALTTGTYNVAVGFEAMRNSTTTSYATAVGYRALYTMTGGGAGLAALGYEALYSNTSGIHNTATGHQALYKTAGGQYNTALGYRALYENISGSNNTAVGVNAGLNATSGSNTAIGHQALMSVSSSGSNTAIGYAAMWLATGSQNTAAGAGIDPLVATAYTNASVLGANAISSGSNTVRFGDSSVTTISGQVAWSFPSDRRDKHDIHDTDLGLDFLMKLRPVRYRLNNGNERSDYGFIAQEVESALDGRQTNMIRIQDDARHSYIFRSSDLISPIVKGVQEQQQSLSAMESEMARLRQRLQAVGNPSSDGGRH